MKIGDVVTLKCGGPKMVVDRVYTDREGTVVAHTVWYATDKELRYAALPVDAFVQVPA